MEIFRMEENNINKSFCCYNEKCWELALYKVDRANFELIGECKMGHRNSIKIISKNERSNKYEHLNIYKILKRKTVVSFFATNVIKILMKIIIMNINVIIVINYFVTNA